MTTKKPKLNVRLLRRIQKHILEEPRRFVMRSVIQRQSSGTSYFQSDGMGRVPFPKCGTSACIAGWALLLSGKPVGHSGWQNDANRAAVLLGVPKVRPGIWSWTGHHSLFLANEWPTTFKKRYEAAITQATRVKIAAERIEHFIKTKGAE